MKKYRVWVKVEGIMEVEVEAGTLDEAINFAIEEAQENTDCIELDYSANDWEEPEEEEEEP